MLQCVNDQPKKIIQLMIYGENIFLYGIYFRKCYHSFPEICYRYNNTKGLRLFHALNLLLNI